MSTKVFANLTLQCNTVQRLGQMTVHTGILCCLDIFGKGICCHCQNGHCPGIRTVQSPYRPGSRLAIHHGHLNIHKKNVIEAFF